MFANLFERSLVVVVVARDSIDHLGGVRFVQRAVFGFEIGCQHHRDVGLWLIT